MAKPYTACLDQNAISALARGISPFWCGLRERLILAAEHKKIVCPIPGETKLETLPCPRETRIAIRDLAMTLSKGLAFKTYFTMLAEETLALLRPNMLPNPVIIAIWNDNIADDGMAQEIHRNFTQLKTEREQLVRQMPDPVNTANFSHEDFYQALSLSRAQDFYQQIHRMASGQAPDPNSMLIDVCRYLEREKITPVELETLKGLIINKRWNSIRLLFFHTKLSAISEQHLSRSGKDKCKPRQYQFNDEYDRTRLSIGLSYSDLVHHGTNS